MISFDEWKRRGQFYEIDQQYNHPQQFEVFEKYYFDSDASDYAVAFWNKHIVHTKDRFAGKRFILQPWQETIVRNIFGWREKGTGKRRFKTLYLEVPRKNGKTEFIAGLVLLLIILEGVVNGEVYSIATNEKQASESFKRAKAMIEYEPVLDALFTRYSKFIETHSGTIFRPLTSKADGKHGLHTTYLLSDELHEWASDELWQFVSDGMEATYDPMELKTTTAGKIPGVGYDEHLYAKKVLNGILFNPRYYPVIYAANDNESDEYYGDPATWKAANPNYHVMDEDRFAEKWQKALESPAKKSAFLKYNLNIWKEGGSDWVNMDRWKQCVLNDNDPDFWKKLPALLKGRKCYGGLDLAKTTDLASFVLWFPPIGNETKGHVLTWFFMPGDNVELLSKTDKISYLQWIDQGAIIATDGDVIDYDVIEDVVVQAAKDYNLQYVAFDQWSAEKTRQNLEKKGIRMIKFIQGIYSFAGPCREFVRLVYGRLINHGSNPVLSWMASNVTAKEDHNKNQMPDKLKSTGHIDGIVSLIMAIGIEMNEQKPEKEDKRIIDMSHIKKLDNDAA